jgi:membrane-associated phospholipid phosphatase
MLVCAWFVAGGALPALAQTAATGSAADSSAAAARRGVYPHFGWSVDAPVVGASVALLAGGVAMTTDKQVVPPVGLDPGGIHWSVDRDAIGHNSTDANAASNWFRNAAVIYPMALTFASAPGGERWRVTATRAIVYGEAVLVAESIAGIVKVSTARPRPFTYLPESERPDHPKYDVTDSRAFQSMPSGHAATSWCAASFAITDHLISRPQAGWLERSAVGFVGGWLASSTARLRVEAGQHFPSDVMTGSLIGAASGVSVPLLHRWFRGHDRAPMPSGHAWLQALAGTAVGVGAGYLTANAFDDPSPGAQPAQILSLPLPE